jgi:hypothetical protein
MMIVASFGPIFIGFAIYFIVKEYRRRQGLDLSLAFTTIPPE